MFPLQISFPFIRLCKCSIDSLVNMRVFSDPADIEGMSGKELQDFMTGRSDP